MVRHRLFVNRAEHIVASACGIKFSDYLEGRKHGVYVWREGIVTCMECLAKWEKKEPKPPGKMKTLEAENVRLRDVLIDVKKDIEEHATNTLWDRDGMPQTICEKIDYALEALLDV